MWCKVAWVPLAKSSHARPVSSVFWPTMGLLTQARTAVIGLPMSHVRRSSMWTPFIYHMPPPPSARFRNQGGRFGRSNVRYQVSVAKTTFP